MNRTRVAVIGLGGIAQLVHLPILNKIKTVDIVAVSEINKNRLNTVADKFAVEPRYTDYIKMLGNEEIDAVIIATPTNTHHKIAIDCLKYKKHILVEKPVATTFKETKEICEAAKKSGKHSMVGMNFRFRPDAMLLKSLINSGEMGDIFYIRAGWARKQSGNEDWFSKKKIAGGGAIIDLGIVLLDLSMWLLGYPELQSISVQKYHHRTKGVEDSAVGFVRFKNSAVINFDVSWSFHSEKDSFALTAFGTEGTAHLNPLKAYKRTQSGNIDFTPSTSTNIKNLYKKSYENELKHFIGTLQSNMPLVSSCDDALKRMELIEGMYKSAELNQEINFG